MTYLLPGLAAVIVIQGVALVLMWRRRQCVSSIEGRIKQLSDALVLLTDTTQAGLASVASEIERGRGPRPGSAGRAATSRRIAHAVGRGRAVRDVAAEEHVSESEIRLHLGLATERSEALRVIDNEAPRARGTERRSWLEPSTSH